MQTPSLAAVVAPPRSRRLEEFILSKFCRGLDELKVKGYDISQALLRSVLSTLSKWKVRMSKAYS